MSNLTYSTTAASRPRTLGWSALSRVAGVVADHNSIAQPVGDAPEMITGRTVDAKPAAPPRGIPR